MAKEDLEMVGRALMTVTAEMPGDEPGDHQYPVLGIDSNFDDLPTTCADSTVDDAITREAVVKLARAAIWAILVPTDEMMDAGAAVLTSSVTDADRKRAADIYKAMILALLRV